MAFSFFLGDAELGKDGASVCYLTHRMLATTRSFDRLGLENSIQVTHRSDTDSALRAISGASYTESAQIGRWSREPKPGIPLWGKSISAGE